MISSYIDAGQVLIAGLISIIGFFIKKELATISRRLDKHDEQILKLITGAAELIGAFNARQRDRIPIKSPYQDGAERTD